MDQEYFFMYLLLNINRLEVFQNQNSDKAQVVSLGDG